MVGGVRRTGNRTDESLPLQWNDRKNACLAKGAGDQYIVHMLYIDWRLNLE